MLLSSPLKCPEQFDANRYMVNIGLALKELSSQQVKAGASVANLNVLPAAYRPRPPSLVRILALPSALTAIGLLVPLVILAQSASTNIDSIRSQLDMTNQLISEKQLQEQELQHNIAEAEASHHTFTAALDSLDKQGNKVNGDLKTSTSLPQVINLTSISHDISILTLSGWGASEAEILSYARSLDASGRFSEILIASMRRIEDGRLDFTLVLKTKEPG